ncbi:DoxX family membrane protein [Leptospira congkakensis]|uniref:DoxX family membrane protein n=1 Tax=Leptospira congkakensis TaxID=2484932 RepID=A0A4Z1ALB8_9LEPT|nr:DoxX family membrane protein [Leptospira congkakensis]TGL90527.1 DoxX family membrane protein [Leptospira congkakensis]TGL91534.1 DoxX family membrane protein [Leptospira congkakensis]TGL98587.1 DoxX family membrane protein [Leptospira congkakensis]
MKIAYLIVRVLLGALFLFSSVVVLFNLVPQPETTGDLKVFNDGIKASGYLMTLIKVTELVVAIAFISGKFVPLAAVVIAPVAINILLVHLTIAPEGIPVGIFVVVANAFIAYVNRNAYKPLFVAVYK